MKKRIYLARHGETDWNREGRIQGHTDMPLNRTGEEQARRLAEAISGLEIGAIVSSPLKRAARTAEILGEKFGLPASFNDGLIEACFGECEGMNNKEISDKLAKYLVWNGTRVDWEKSSVPGHEKMAATKLRLKKAFAEIFSDPPPDDAMIVSHGVNMRALTGVKCKNCACFRAMYDTETGEISDVECVYEGEISHAPGPMPPASNSR
jgi:broad specificity phosphatase PhoE